MADDPPFSASGPYSDFSYGDLLTCYANGIFPMAEARDDPRIFLVEPEQRGLIPLNEFHIPTRLRRTIRGEPFDVRVSTDFAGVLDACAAAMPDRQDTWINAPIRSLYIELHERGFAHSIECWHEGQLVGGLYGVTLGGAFFGESMFSRARDASKVALVHLVARMKKGGWQLLDTQFLTEHLGQFGARETSQAEYLKLLGQVLNDQPDVQAFTRPISGEEAVGYALQPITQAS